MPAMTDAEFAATLAACNFADPDAVSKLVTSTHTNVKFNEQVEVRQAIKPLGAYNYFGGLFGKEVWGDGQGMDLIREYYAPSHIPLTFSHFVRQSAICDPNLANECNRIACQIPEGGRGTLPSQVFFKAGLKTPRDCIANIRHIRQFQWWASKIIDDRERADEQIMNIFYLMAGIQTAGNKITMQGCRDANGLLKLCPDNNPRNPLHGGYYNYMEERFPQPTNLQDMVPLTVDSMEGMARHWAQFPVGNEAAKGPRGENIYEFWYPDDWYLAEAIRNPDYMEKLKLTMPNLLFAGTTLAPGDREVIGNWAPRVMPWLPRFAPTSDGRIVPVDNLVGVDIEVGKEYVGSLEFENAPFGIAMIVSGKQGTILTRPTLTQSGAGFPILPIAGDMPWRIRNDYDAICNEQLNQPYSEKFYEMGFRMDDPQAATALLFRRRIFPMRPINECDLAPIFQVVPNEIDCPVTTVGCSDNNRRVEDGITELGGATYVSCTSHACGNTATAPFHYILKIDRKANMPDYNSLGCPCGSAVSLYVYDEDGAYVKQIQGVYKSDVVMFPEARVFVETTVALAVGQCIKGISCADTTPFAGNAIDSWDAADIVGPPVNKQVGFILNDSISCKAGGSVSITYYDAANVLLGTKTGTIVEVDLDRFYYLVKSADLTFKADAYATQASVTVTCTTPNTLLSDDGDDEDPDDNSDSDSSTVAKATDKVTPKVEPKSKTKATLGDDKDEDEDKKGKS